MSPWQQLAAWVRESRVAWQPKVKRGGLYFVRIKTRAVRRWVVLE